MISTASPIPLTNSFRARRCRCGRAFTLVESLLAGVILSIAVLGVCSMLAASYQQNANLNQTVTALALGRQLMDEIMAKPLANPSGGSTTPVSVAASGSRSAFTYAGQYNHYSDSGASLTTLGGASVNATSGGTYTRTVSVTLSAKPSGDTQSPSSDFALVTVTVTTPTGQQVALRGIMTNYGFTR